MHSQAERKFYFNRIVINLSVLFGWYLEFAHIILFYLTTVMFRVFLVYLMEHCNLWPMRSWRKATVNILEHESTRSWWILSARVCIVDCIHLKAHKFNQVRKPETLDLKPWQTRTYEVLWLWSHSQLRVDDWSVVIYWKETLPSTPLSTRKDW